MATVDSRPEPVRLDDYGADGRSEWLDVDWREHQRWVRVDERWVNLVDLGPREGAEPVVFVHGLGGCWQNWLENIPHFARSRRVVAVDLPGHGFSEMPAEEISIPGYGRFLDALLGELEIEAACVVGNSMGGYIGAELAISAPPRVERLVLVAAAGITSVHMRNEPGLAALRTREVGLAYAAGRVAKAADRLARRPGTRLGAFWFVAAHPSRLPGPLVAEQLRGVGKPAFLHALDAVTDYPIQHRLPEIACPTLIVWGAKDRVVPVRDAYVYDRLIPDSRLVVWADTGHVPQMERPDAFNAEVEAFLAEKPAAARGVAGP
jgi:pimeloyl-ACP methyl ester carboxylesterase